MNKKTTWFLIIILTIGAFFVGSFYSDYRENKKAELINEGINEGVILTAQQITQGGNIPVVINSTIQWIPLQQLCIGIEQNTQD